MAKEYKDLVVGLDLGYHDHDLAGPDVKPYHQVFIFFVHSFTFSFSCRLCH